MKQKTYIGIVVSFVMAIIFGMEVYASSHETNKKASSLTRKTQQRLLSERNSLLKKYGLEKLKSGFFSSKSGFSGVVDSVKKYAFMIFGIKTTKSIVKDLLKGMCPIYTSEDEQTLVEYMEDYFGTLYGKVTGKCPLYS